MGYGDGQPQKGRGAGGGGGGGRGAGRAASARAPIRRFQLENADDADGWVCVVSDGPAPRVSSTAAAADRQRGAGAGGLGGGMVAPAIINFKRFCKAVGSPSQQSGLFRCSPLLLYPDLFCSEILSCVL